MLLPCLRLADAEVQWAWETQQHSTHAGSEASSPVGSWFYVSTQILFYGCQRKTMHRIGWKDGLLVSLLSLERGSSICPPQDFQEFLRGGRLDPSIWQETQLPEEQNSLGVDSYSADCLLNSFLCMFQIKFWKWKGK